MTPEEINIAIAEHLGWTNCRTFPKHPKHWECSDRPEAVRIGSPPRAGSCTFLNYHDDLNAMHEAEKILTTDDAHSFYWRLELDLGWEYASATAAQRAEAFLRTVGKWKEGA